MTNAQEQRCHVIIHTASAAAAAAGAGLAQLPCADAAVIVPIQVGMVVALAGVFGVTLTRTAAESAVATKAATLIGRGVSQLLVGWIPGFGNACNAATAAGVTEAVGWAVARDFAGRGG